MTSAPEIGSRSVCQTTAGSDWRDARRLFKACNLSCNEWSFPVPNQEVAVLVSSKWDLIRAMCHCFEEIYEAIQVPIKECW